MNRAFKQMNPEHTELNMPPCTHLQYRKLSGSSMARCRSRTVLCMPSLFMTSLALSLLSSTSSPRRVPAFFKVFFTLGLVRPPDASLSSCDAGPSPDCWSVILDSQLTRRSDGGGFVSTPILLLLVRWGRAFIALSYMGIVGGPPGSGMAQAPWGPAVEGRRKGRSGEAGLRTSEGKAETSVNTSDGMGRTAWWGVPVEVYTSTSVHPGSDE
mmetsp:Transcript_32495/g.107090  ORF Transcript_32495/g.107090 Transcript_32495/m.107090 type:complete len:212 (+) Transcript_32495:1268-1903(+)